MENETLAIVAAILGGGGLGGTIVAFVKMRPEANRILVDAAEGAVVVQVKVIAELRTEIERARKEAIEDARLAREEQKECELQVQELQKILRAVDERKSTPRRADDQCLEPSAQKKEGEA